MLQKWICNKCGYETEIKPENRNSTCCNCKKGRFRCWNKRATIINKCKYCGKDIKTTKSENKVYCNNKCRDLDYRNTHKGELSYFWQGGKTKESKLKRTNAQYKELKSNTTFVNIEKLMKALRNQELAEIENIPEYKELKDMDNKYIARLDNVKAKLGNKPMTLDNIRAIDVELADAYKAFLDKDGANKTENDNSVSLLRSSWHNEALVSNPKITGIFTDNINKIPEEYLEKAQEEHLPIVIFDISN